MDNLKEIMTAIQSGAISADEGVRAVKEFFLKDLGFATIDTMRESRVGYPEVIYCAGKTVEQVHAIVQYMLERTSNILATKANEAMYESIKTIEPEAVYHPLSKTVVIRKDPVEPTDSYIAVITAGTSDLPVAEEAAVTAELYGNRVITINDVGVAGIHRLFDKIETIRKAKVNIVIAGMEGALASVVAGLVDKPVIAVPTSVGYGANFGGLAALLGMLNSCAGGISVVNIDNGFGAGYLAGMINKL
jgi:hypothetical protein